MTVDRRAWPSEARLDRRQARFNSQKHPSGCCISLRASENRACWLDKDGFRRAFPFWAVARAGMDWLGEECSRRKR